MKNNFKIIFVIIGTLIGAGFASGQEIYTFFFSYGEKGILAIIISSLLMGIIIYDVLKIIQEKKIENYKDFLGEIVAKAETRKSCSVKGIINIIVNLFILVTFYIMIAGFGAYCMQQFQVNALIGSMILATTCWTVLKKDIKGVVLLNQIIVPILILFVIILGVLNISQIDLDNISDYIIRVNHTNWVISGILYSSYNAILLIPVLITLRKYLKKDKQIAKIASSVTMITAILAFMIFGILIKVDVEIENLEMPVAYVISQIYPYLKIPYAFLLLSSILTTALSLGNSLIENVAKDQKQKGKIRNFICISGILISGIGFSNLINALYPIFGYLGILQVFAILRRAKKIQKKY